MNDFKKIFAPLASLRLTIGLLLLAMVLVFAGTTAQREMGIQDVQHQFFHSWAAKIQLHYFQPSPPAKPGQAPGDGFVRGYFYLPGGYSIICLMLVNLLAAHTVRFKLRAKRIGIILTHAGLILLLVGEIMTSLLAVETQMPIDVNASTNFSSDIRTTELAVTDPSPADHNNVTVVNQSRLESAAENGKSIHDPQLPFDVKVNRWYPNSTLPEFERIPKDGDAHDVERLAARRASAEHLATAGEDRSTGILGLPKVSGAGADAERNDLASAFVTFEKEGRSLGNYALSVIIGKPQTVTVDGKLYLVELRFRRYYKPYTVTLKQFTHEIIPGTTMPKDFASTIQLVAPQNNVDREVRIWMNHPLRYNGETFYQQSFANEDRTSVLQIVHNPAWIAPYIACAVGALGLVIHFGITLTSFLRRRYAPAPNSAAAMRGRAGNKTASTAKKSDAVKETYTLRPEPAWRTVGIPLGVLLVSIIYVISRFFVTAPAQPYDLDSFAHLPIFIEGRSQPLDSVARNLLGIVSNGKYVNEYPDGPGHMHPAIEWLADTMTRSNHWADYKVIRIDHPDIKSMLGLKDEDKMFSWNEINLDSPKVRQTIEDQARLAGKVSGKERDAYQNQVLELHQHLGVLVRLLQVEAISFVVHHGDQVQSAVQQLREKVISDNPQLLQDLRSGKAANPQRSLNDAIIAAEASLSEAQRTALDKPATLDRLRGMGPEGQLFLIPPSGKDGWRPLDSVVQDPDKIPESADLILKIMTDYGQGNAADFNADLAAYQSRLKALPDMKTVNYEVGFNRFGPFAVCLFFYVLIFILAFFSWLGWTRPLWRTGYALMVLALIVHTVGVISRIYISGRPPVTSTYSAAVFIGWGVVLFSLGLEAIYRNGVGLVAGSAAGFVSLLVAAGFAVGDGDTMKQLQAVLDTNFWLATHVVCVSLGYMASGLAGILGTIYILRGLLDRSYQPNDAKDNLRMLYGIACFAILFSFVGTILGGIWADQSWGRFWGWDPKENGAVLVVLWNAVILHSRWAGIVRDRGLAVLAILGNIVVGWSFVGTNQLGIGLHSYGFMSGAQMALIAWILANLALAAIGLTPLRFWSLSARKV